MLKSKHLRLDQDKIERVKNILKTRTETDALDQALDKVIQEDVEKARRKRIMRRIVALRDRLGKIEEDSA